ncbi:MAG TPA: hypothetical protein P5032_01190 [Candidatus Competibacter sp.]|nr:hypothetical protein [Candidatus Competibacter sp.]
MTASDNRSSLRLLQSENTLDDATRQMTAHRDLLLLGQMAC